jgi:ribulose-bisphosphate carboxylase large chain
MSTFDLTYWVTTQDDEEIEEKVEGICIEQTAELPRGVLSSEINKNVVGNPVNQQQIKQNCFEVTISWPLATVGGDISQFLNILYGNISLQPGILVTDAEWQALAPDIFGGPFMGISTIREAYQINDRPLSATALKPMGSSPAELADIAYAFARGGIDIIKDDHGLANQDFAPFDERLSACTESVQKADSHSRYFPNVTAFATETVDRYKMAAEAGADGVLLCPHIAGLETMHRLARLDIDLPIIAHPAFSGSLTTNPDKGLRPDFLYGQLWRALGADFVIYPNKGGRFSFSSGTCKKINRAARRSESSFNRSFPMPGGGITLESMAKWIKEYGKDVAYLIGGSLYEHPAGITEAARLFRQQLTQT